MSTTKLNVLIDQCIHDNLKLNYCVYAKLGNRWDQNPLPMSADLDAGITYQLRIWLQNTSPEISFTNIKLTITPPRLMPASPSPKKCVELYGNEALTQKLADQFDISMNGLLAPSKTTQIYYYFFKVIRDFDSGHTVPLLHVMIRADVLPRGVYHQDMAWKV